MRKCCTKLGIEFFGKWLISLNHVTYNDRIVLHSYNFHSVQVMNQMRMRMTVALRAMCVTPIRNSPRTTPPPQTVTTLRPTITYLQYCPSRQITPVTLRSPRYPGVILLLIIRPLLITTTKQQMILAVWTVARIVERVPGRVLRWRAQRGCVITMAEVSWKEINSRPQFL